MSDTLTYTGHLERLSCWCGILLAVPSSLEREWREHGQAIYCPLGHTFVPYGGTDTERLRRQKAQLEARLTSERDQRRATERSLSATKGQLTKVKRRIHKGVCPGCGRHFANVERHMASKHPEMGDV